MKVAIIGAGLAGAYLANQLVAQGHDVVVFEKSRGIGGRMNTKTLDFAAADLGAQYFTLRDQRFEALKQQWLQQDVIAPWRFTPYTYKNQQLAPSPDNETRYVGMPGMRAPAQTLLDGIVVHYTTCIVGLQRQARGWQLEDHLSQCHAGFDRVVCAIPADQAKVLLANTSLGTRIPTDLHLPCWAVALHSSDKVDPALCGIFSDDEFSWVSRNGAKPGRDTDCWILHASADYSASKPREAAQEVAEDAKAWLQRVVGVKQIDDQYVHFWRFARQNPVVAAPGLLQHTSEGIAAIGDWCEGGRVEGALLSAHNLLHSEFFS